MQRVVSRSELNSEDAPSSYSASEGEATEALHALDQLEFIEASHGLTTTNDDSIADEEVDFRLFAPSKLSTSQKEAKLPQKIRLRSPSVDDSNAGFVRTERNSNYYFAGPLSQSEQENIESSALSGQQIIELSKSYRPGSTYNWKILRLPPSNLAKSLPGAGPSLFHKLTDDAESQRRKRPGKKARIEVRVRQETLQEQQLAGKAAADAKDAAEREKRTKRNREKKVKKKMRDKAKKAELTEKASSPTPNE